MNKEALLKELSGSTYVMIMPSPLHGIGVFAIRDILGITGRAAAKLGSRLQNMLKRREGADGQR